MRSDGQRAAAKCEGTITVKGLLVDYTKNTMCCGREEQSTEIETVS